MGTSTRSSRRRRRPRVKSAEAKRGPPLLKRSEAAAAVALAGFVFLFVGIALLASGGTGDSGAATGDAGATAPDVGAATTEDGAAADDEQPTVSDEEAIQSLARRSIEVLPAGQWSSLYDSFTSEFQQRCPREEFEQVGVVTAAELGDDLRLLRFNRLESMTIEGSSAQVVIVGEVVGEFEYDVQAAFQKENDAWKIAPAPDTQGCEAFLVS